MKITKKMAADMMFISFCTHYRHSEDRDEIERTLKAISRGGMLRAFEYCGSEDLSAYYGRWGATIIPVLEGLYAQT